MPRRFVGAGIEGTNVMGMVTTASLEALVAMLEEGAIATPDIHTFPLADAGQALAAESTGHVRGKIVVTV
jgi:NADPH:quinone reductase-like Zn-dependent oxidoreductase